MPKPSILPKFEKIIHGIMEVDQDASLLEEMWNARAKNAVLARTEETIKELTDLMILLRGLNPEEYITKPK